MSGKQDNLADVYAYVDAHADDYIVMLQELLRQPSVAAQAVGMEETAEMVRARLDSMGFSPRLVDTRGGFPVVYGEKAGKSARTLSFYDHYDVQPAEPLEQWESDPWAAEIRD